MGSEEREGSQKAWGNLGADGCAHYVDCGDGFTGAHLCQNLAVVHFKYGWLIVCQVYLSETVKNKQPIEDFFLFFIAVQVQLFAFPLHPPNSPISFFLRFYLFIFREREREGEREGEKHQCVVAS